MQDIQSALTALQHGGAMVYPLLFLALAALVVLLDKALVYRRHARLPESLRQLVETYGFAWSDLERSLQALGALGPERGGNAAGQDAQQQQGAGDAAAGGADPTARVVGRGSWRCPAAAWPPVSRDRRAARPRSAPRGAGPRRYSRRGRPAP